MAQFVVRVYGSPAGCRVVVDGIASFDAPTPDAVEAMAREVILGRLASFLPHRARPPADPDVVRTFGFDIALQRAGEMAGSPSDDDRPVRATPPRSRKTYRSHVDRPRIG